MTTTATRHDTTTTLIALSDATLDALLARTYARYRTASHGYGDTARHVERIRRTVYLRVKHECARRGYYRHLPHLTLVTR